MQFKLLTLALFASFFATGFTAPIYPGLTEAESISISPLVQTLGLTDPTKEQADCIGKVAKNYKHLFFDGVATLPAFANITKAKFNELYQKCLQNLIGFKYSDAHGVSRGLQ
ncbi:hypothetical protein BCV72DRAFT_246234 [Rhizopus microsporus var. microsporus]|uniref:Uncharacterized protein n=2 Tax=Rhizopus microsporus TaxID=58291 RepID=A0A2G4SW87_RHIZD|nr:uncharacterized protein RHIMIDRAFT_251109 [Rhizopus microsporus ATCC 52813]ORE01039.1 hypothetical protein BCV72DRAFT_246234 [Rhizopus microsporus var. microsporus]PHZ13015.1 hypothetical protein RHIMIDRAFT_251109 [Rhizopus microsporus ATCC 52813]